MSFRVQFKVLHFKDGLTKAPTIFSRNFKGGLLAVGKRLRASAISRMRKDTGEAQKNLRIRVTAAGLNMNVVVFATVIQAFIDAYGLRRGVFPPFGINSRIYAWAKRRERRVPIKTVKTFAVPAGPAERPIPKRRKLKRVKRIKKVQGQRTVARKGRARARETNIRRMSFLIARAVFRHGIKGTLWHKRALEANRDRIVREMSNALARSVNELKRG